MGTARCMQSDIARPLHVHPAFPLSSGASIRIHVSKGGAGGRCGSYSLLLARATTQRPKLPHQASRIPSPAPPRARGVWRLRAPPRAASPRPSASPPTSPQPSPRSPWATWAPEPACLQWEGPACSCCLLPGSFDPPPEHATNVLELLASPSELLASPSELLASHSELLASPSELMASPSELLASPNKLS
jgi:hypothetical protein